MPIFDIAAALYNYDTWSDTSSDQWTKVYTLQAASGGLLFVTWGLNQVLPTLFESVFELNTKVHILVEAANLVYVYIAEDRLANTENEATYFSYFAGGVGLLASLALNLNAIE